MSLQQADRAASPPSQALPSPPSTFDEGVTTSTSATEMSALTSSTLSIFTIPRRPSDEWREFFNLDGSSVRAEEVDQTSEGKLDTEEGADNMVIDQDVSWDSVFADNFDFGDSQAGSSRSAQPGSSTAPHRQRRSIHSQSSLASPTCDLDSFSSASMTSTAPTSHAPSPAATIAEFKGDPSPSVLQPVVASSSGATLPPSTGAPSGYSSLMPRRPPPSVPTQAPKVRKGRSAVDVVKARSQSQATYPGGAAAWLSLAESERPFINEAAPQSAPATTTVFSRRLATNARTFKTIKAEESEQVKEPFTRTRVAAKPKSVLVKKISVDEIAPAVEKPAPVSRPRKPKIKPEGHTPRPPNAWILYRSAQIQILMSDANVSKKPQSDICKSRFGCDFLSSCADDSLLGSQPS